MNITEAAQDLTTYLLDTYINLARANAALEAESHDEAWSHGIRLADLAGDIEAQFPKTARNNVAADLGHLRSWADRSQQSAAAAGRASAEMRAYYKGQVESAEDAIDRLRAFVLGYTR